RRAGARDPATRELRCHPGGAFGSRFRARFAVSAAGVRCRQRDARSCPERARRAALVPAGRVTFLRRLGAAGVGLFTGITAALLLSDANYVALGAASVFAILVFLFAREVTPPGARRDIYLLVALALTLRYAMAVTIHDASLAAGRGGFVTGDDATYADFS